MHSSVTAPATNHTKINFAKAAPRGVKRGFCVSKTSYSAGFCGLPVHKPLHRLPPIFDLLGVFGGILLKTSRLLQNDLQVVMCLIIKALIVRTFSGFFGFDCSPNNQKKLIHRRFPTRPHTSHLRVFCWTIAFRMSHIFFITTRMGRAKNSQNGKSSVVITGSVRVRFLLLIRLPGQKINQCLKI
jgi:hypothetical protein